MGDLTLYNTLGRQKQAFIPLESGVVRMYNCGPTVYDHPHIGNFRSFLFADVLRRYLEYRRYSVQQVMNLTDVGHLLDDRDEGEDKIDKQARVAKRAPLDIANTYAAEFFRLAKLFEMRAPLAYPRATDHIPEMVAMIKTLVERQFAYVVHGNVYFDVSRFPMYGQLSGNVVAQLAAGVRVDLNADKRHPEDFALWKQDHRHLMQWESPWGKGFPGWHIECSAMARKYLGDSIDIHTGGEDNIFPHHECEIAQSEGCTGVPFVKYWLHVRHLLVRGQKMSKSLGNFLTVEDVLNEGATPRELRYAFLGSHYRDPLNFSLESVRAASKGLARLEQVRVRLQDALAWENGELGESAYRHARSAFEAAMDDDINTPKALAAVFGFARDANRSLDARGLGGDGTRRAGEFLGELLGALGVTAATGVAATSGDGLTADEVDLLRRRDEARRAREWEEADRLRVQLQETGIEVEDLAGSSRWRRCARAVQE